MGGEDYIHGKIIERFAACFQKSADMCLHQVNQAKDVIFFMAINSHDGATQEELTALVGVDKAMTTRVIYSLESKGLVKRVQDTKDKRQNKIYKTDKVNEIREIVLKDLLHLNQIFTAGIGNDDLDIFMRTLAVLEKNISNFLKEEK